MKKITIISILLLSILSMGYSDSLTRKIVGTWYRSESDILKFKEDGTGKEKTAWGIKEFKWKIKMLNNGQFTIYVEILNPGKYEESSMESNPIQQTATEIKSISFGKYKYNKLDSDF